MDDKTMAEALKGAGIDTGDHVRHGPTGEEWVVRYVRGDRLSWCGWPPGEVSLSECSLIYKATPEERAELQDLIDGRRKSASNPTAPADGGEG